MKRCHTCELAFREGTGHRLYPESGEYYCSEFCSRASWCEDCCAFHGPGAKRESERTWTGRIADVLNGIGSKLAAPWDGIARCVRRPFDVLAEDVREGAKKRKTRELRERNARSREAFT